LVARKFSSVASAWAKLLEPQISLCGDAAIIACLCVKQSILHLSAIMCLKLQSFEDQKLSPSFEDYNAVVCNRVHSTNVLKKGFETGLDTELNALLVQVSNVMACRGVEIAQLCCETPDALTEAVRIVLNRTPTTLSWTPLIEGGYATGCFNAQCSQDQLYTYQCADRHCAGQWSASSIVTQNNSGSRVLHSIFWQT
jgi:hypothetical protein